jgi:hypothetical protein
MPKLGLFKRSEFTFVRVNRVVENVGISIVGDLDGGMLYCDFLAVGAGRTFINIAIL